MRCVLAVSDLGIPWVPESVALRSGIIPAGWLVSVRVAVYYRHGWLVLGGRKCRICLKSLGERGVIIDNLKCRTQSEAAEVVCSVEQGKRHRPLRFRNQASITSWSRVVTHQSDYWTYTSLICPDSVKGS